MGYVPFRGLRNAVRDAYDGEGPSRRDLAVGLAEGIGGLLAACGAAKLGIGYRSSRLERFRREAQEKKEREEAERESRYLTATARKIAEHSRISENTAGMALSLLRARDAVAMNGLNPGMVKYPKTRRDLDEALRYPVFCRSDSPFMGFVYGQLPPHLQKFIRDNVNVAIFTDEVVRKLAFMEDEVGGISLGSGVIMLSRDDFELYPSRAGHEARHENEIAAASKPGKTLRTLASERGALYTERDILEWQWGSLEASQKGRERTADDLGREYRLASALASVQERLRTAGYLGMDRFGEMFDEVYPENVILSKELLEARPPVEFLERIVREIRLSDELDRELHYAAKATSTALGKPREYAIRELHEIIGTPNAEGFGIINAVFALAYLAPNAVRIRTHDPFRPRGAHVSMWAREGPDAYRVRRFIPDPEQERLQREIYRTTEEFSKMEGGCGPRLIPMAFPQNQFQAYGNLPPVEVFLENRPVKTDRSISTPLVLP